MYAAAAAANVKIAEARCVRKRYIKEIPYDLSTVSNTVISVELIQHGVRTYM